MSQRRRRVLIAVIAYLALVAAWDYAHPTEWADLGMKAERGEVQFSARDEHFPTSLLLLRTVRCLDHRPPTGGHYKTFVAARSCALKFSDGEGLSGLDR